MGKSFTSVLLLCLAASVARADTVGDMRAALARLGGRSAISATYEVQRSRKSEGRFVNDNFTGKVRLELESDSAAFQLVFPQALLATINNEQMIKLRDPKKDTPTLNALWGVSPMSASQALNFAPALVRMIDGAKVVDDHAETVHGAPGHRLVFDLPPSKQARGTIEIGSVTIEKDRLTLWLGADGIPVSAEHIRVTKASAFIFKGETQQLEKWTFGKENDRLLPTRYESSGSGSGLGQKGTTSVITTLTPHG
jgi:hypothetical protein